MYVGVVLALSLYVFGQRDTGTITGTVTDPSGAVVSGAKVTAKSVGTGAVRSATTNSAGAYTMAGLPPAQYEVTVESPNFAKSTQRVTVTVGSTNEISAKLAVAGQGTTVEVIGTGGGTQVETQSSELSQIVSGTSVTQLPSLTRNPYDFVATAGNVAEDPSPAMRGAGGMTLNGQRSASTDILLDGAENVDLFLSNVGQQVPLDSVQEFRVTTTDFGAEYGRASGGVVNVATKSGTNSFHGSAYEFNRLSALASNTYDNGATGIPKQVFTRNQFGYSIGGPVVKDKLFFFNSTEWTRVRSNGTQLAYVVDPSFLSLTSPNTQAWFNAYGHVKPNATQVRTLTANDLAAEGVAGGPGTLFSTLVPGGTPVLDEVQYSFPADVGGGPPQNTWNSIVRLDYNMTDKTQFFGRYAVFHDNLFPGFGSSNAYAGYDTGQTDLNQNVLLSLTHIWSPSLLTSTKFSYNRLNNLSPLSTAGVAPNLFYNTGGQINVGPDQQTTMLPGYFPTAPGTGGPFGGPQNISQLTQDLSWTHGKHQFKFGGQYVYLRDNRTFGAYEEGQNFLANTSSSEAFDALIAGTGLYEFQAAIFPQGKFPCFHNIATGSTIQTPACTLTTPLTPPSFSRSNRYNDMALYAMDTWKVTNRLTLNLGLRWEYYGIQHNKDHSLDSNIVLPASAGNTFQQIAAAYVGQGNNNTPGQNLINNNLWQPQYHNFAPRIGFAYDLFGDGKTSLRGGYGIAYERNFGNVTFNIIQNPPNYGVVQLFAPSQTIPLQVSNFGPLGGSIGDIRFPSPSLRAVDPNIKTAYTHMWNLSLERELARNTVLAFEYSGSRGLHLYSIQNINDFNMGAVYNGYPADAAWPVRINPQYGSINFRGSTGDNYHNALNTRFQTNNLANTGLSLTANYTWSHTIDNLSATFGGSSEEPNGNTLGYLDAFNPRLDLGDSDYDIRHRLVVSAIWDVPLGKNSNGFMKEAAGGWELAPIFNARSGSPLTVYDCTFDDQFNCPRYIPSSAPPLSGTTSTSNPAGPNVFNYLTLPVALAYNPTVPSASGPVFVGSGLPTCAGLFNDGCTFPAGMTRRNAFRQPGYWNMNFGIYKNFKLTERFNMQFRSEFYNLFNHSNYYVQTGPVTAALGTPADMNGQNPTACAASFTCATGAIEQTAPGVIVGKKGVQNALFAGSLGERRFIQFALKLTF